MFKNYFSYLFPTKDEQTIKRALLPLRSIHMDDATKARTRALLQEYMEMQPSRPTTSYTATPSPFAMITIISHQRYLVPICAVVLVFGLTAGTAFAAEDTLPGDTLYPIKVHITEEVRSALATTPKAQAAWQIERTTRRLEEASTLAVEGNLTDQNRTEIEKDLADHVAATERSAEALAATEDYMAADSVGAKLHAVLKAHGDILASVLPEVENTNGSFNSDALVSDVIAHLDSAAKITERSETLSTNTSARVMFVTAERQKAAENEIDSLRSSIDTSLTAAPELIARAEAQFKMARSSYEAGVAALSNTTATTALRDFTTARNVALNTKASLSAQTRLLNVSLRLAKTARDDNTDSVAAKAPSLEDTDTHSVRTASLMRTTSSSTTEVQLEKKAPSQRTRIQSVIGVLLHGNASSTQRHAEEQDPTVKDTSTTEGSHDQIAIPSSKEEENDHRDLIEVEHLGL